MIFVILINVYYCMFNLFDVYVFVECYFYFSVFVGFDIVLMVDDVYCCNGGMVRYLFGDEFGVCFVFFVGL